jgi:hypothetical protein
VNTDFSVIKNFPFHESMNVQFRDGLGDSGQQDINTPSSFGVINNTVNNPRLVQFALRLAF